MFESQLVAIQNPKIRNFTSLALYSVPAHFFTFGASSTGKYHPDFAKGEGGLYRHTQAAVLFATTLLNLAQYKHSFSKNSKDYIIAALILHDSCKYGRDIAPQKFSCFDHPQQAKRLLADLASKKIVSKRFAKIVGKLIASHMGEWNTSKYAKGKLPLPKSKAQKFVHLCDFLASRQFLEVKLPPC